MKIETTIKIELENGTELTLTRSEAEDLHKMLQEELGMIAISSIPYPTAPSILPSTLPDPTAPLEDPTP